MEKLKCAEVESEDILMSHVSSHDGFSGSDFRLHYPFVSSRHRSYVPPRTENDVLLMGLSLNSMTVSLLVAIAFKSGGGELL